MGVDKREGFGTALNSRLTAHGAFHRHHRAGVSASGGISCSEPGDKLFMHLDSDSVSLILFVCFLCVNGRETFMQDVWRFCSSAEVLFALLSMWPILISCLMEKKKRNDIFSGSSLFHDVILSKQYISEAKTLLVLYR